MFKLQPLPQRCHHLKSTKSLLNHSNMKRSSVELLLQYRWRKALGLCMECGKPVKHGGVQCSLCQFFRYCSPQCLDKDREVHTPMCKVFIFIREMRQVSPECATMMSEDVIHRAQLLDCEGNLISPSVMEDVYVVNSSSSFSRPIAHVVTGSKSDTEVLNSSESIDDALSKQESASVNDTESESTGKCKDYTRFTNERESTSGIKFKKDIESKTDSEILSTSGFKSGRGSDSFTGLRDNSDLKNDNGFTDETRCKTDNTLKSGSQSESDSKTSRSKVQSPDPAQKYVTATFTVKINNGGKPTVVSEVFQQKSSCGAEGSCVRGQFNVPDCMKQYITACAKYRQATKGSCHDKLLNNNQASQQKSSDRISNFSNTETNPTIRQRGEAANQSSGVENSTAVHKLPNSEGHLGKNDAHSSNSETGNRNISNNCSLTSKPESFGLSWWQKSNKDSSKKSTQGNASSKQPSSDKNQQTENGSKEKSSRSKVFDSGDRKVPGSVETSKQTESQEYGLGWWQCRLPQTSSSTTKHEIKQESQTGQSSYENRQQVPDPHQTASNSCESGKVPSKDGAVDKKTFDKSNSSRTASSNHSLDRDASAENTHLNTPGQNGASETSTDRQAPQCDDFGAGWWKPPTKVRNTKSENSTKPTTDKASTSKPECADEQKKQRDKSCDNVNTCTDLIPFKVSLTAEHIVRFAKVASRILSSLIHTEAMHGRVIRMGLISVPALWTASLGGSRVTLVVEIVMRIPGMMPGVIVHDELGHFAQVLFNTSESKMYTVPGTNGLLTLPISACLRPGTFVLLRAVSWEQLQDGSLIIVMKDMSCVDFIFYELFK
ncbi:unnamed protein product [Candidula unifasciata]|uniref:MYND-type domain-containing protein n=1 Tax=Candidula unifasciata TaxID=100452 RepID=A0A8S4A6T6_9EUPU|nr:unnamed protein product [Candidula unifasciata]